MTENERPDPNALLAQMAALESENVRLRRIYSDQRDHLDALRAEVRHLQQEASALMAMRSSLEAEVALMQKARRPSRPLAMIGAAGAALVAGWLAVPTRPVPSSPDRRSRSDRPPA